MKNPKDYIKKYCDIEYNRGLGEDVIISSLSTVITAFNEYAKDLKASLDFNDFGFGDADGEVSDKATCRGTNCNCRRPDKSI